MFCFALKNYTYSLTNYFSCFHVLEFVCCLHACLSTGRSHATTTIRRFEERPARVLLPCDWASGLPRRRQRTCREAYQRAVVSVNRGGGVILTFSRIFIAVILCSCMRHAPCIENVQGDIRPCLRLCMSHSLVMCNRNHTCLVSSLSSVLVERLVSVVVKCVVKDQHTLQRLTLVVQLRH